MRRTALVFAQMKFVCLIQRATWNAPFRSRKRIESCDISANAWRASQPGSCISKKTESKKAECGSNIMEGRKRPRSRIRTDDLLITNQIRQKSITHSHSEVCTEAPREGRATPLSRGTSLVKAFSKLCRAGFQWFPRTGLKSSASKLIVRTRAKSLAQETAAQG